MWLADHNVKGFYSVAPSPSGFKEGALAQINLAGLGQHNISYIFQHMNNFLTVIKVASAQIWSYLATKATGVMRSIAQIATLT